MKFKTSLAGAAVLAVAIAGLSFMLISWDYAPDKFQFAQNPERKDTITPPKVRAENADVNIDLEIKNVMQEMEKALREFDAAKIQAEISKALKEVDMEKMKTELEHSLSTIDSEKIKAEIEKALKNVDFEKKRLNSRKVLQKWIWRRLKETLT